MQRPSANDVRKRRTISRRWSFEINGLANWLLSLLTLWFLFQPLLDCVDNRFFQVAFATAIPFQDG
jgi:hypothetical protein